MVNWAHRWVAVVLEALAVRLPGFRRRLSRSLDDLDRKIRRVRPAVSVACGGDDRLDVDVLRANEELRQLIDLYLRGWTAKEIKEKLGGTKSGRPCDL
jgi:hypothetical protein